MANVENRKKYIHIARRLVKPGARSSRKMPRERTVRKVSLKTRAIAFSEEKCMFFHHGCVPNGYEFGELRQRK